MSESRYLQVFSDATDALLRRVGVDEDRASSRMFYTVESHLVHKPRPAATSRLK